MIQSIVDEILPDQTVVFMAKIDLSDPQENEECKEQVNDDWSLISWITTLTKKIK